jgi:energy-coupling factor transporter ATP-binding protein EcfA2
VSFGLLLQAKPKFLALDEPTSGLDSNSALLVMSSLKNLAALNGTTICCVIHQPRKFIFELFDSLVLLGVGGHTVYHGPIAGAENYFSNLNYSLPPGESVADWLIDIASGRLEPIAADVEQGGAHHKAKIFERKHNNLDLESSTGTTEEEDSSLENPTVTEEASAKEEEKVEEQEEVYFGAFEDYNPEYECAVNSWEWTQIGTFIDPSSLRREESKPMLSDPSAVEFENDAAQAKTRRDLLFKLWKKHIENLSDEERKAYCQNHLTFLSQE